MRILKKHSGKMIKATLVTACAILFFMGRGITGLADTTGKVITSAIVRQAADVNSEKVGGFEQGKVVTIVNEVTDASGTLWYEVSEGNTKGYVRGDLIEKGAASDGNEVASAAPAPAPQVTASGAEGGPETAMDAQYATVKATKANIRSKASKSSGTVDSMPQNTTLIVSGKSTGDDGKIWYYVTFTGTSGSEKNGFVREDLITLGDMVPVEETPETEPELPTEEPTVEPVVSPDYEVIYENPDGEGYAWYLHDNTGENSYRQNLETLLAASEAYKINAEVDDVTISRQRIAIVLLVVLVIILVVAVTFMFFKLRDSFFEEDDDDDNDRWKADRSSRPVRENSGVRSSSSGSRRPNEQARRPVEGGQTQVRRRPPEGGQSQARRRPPESEGAKPARENVREEGASSASSQAKPEPKKKAKNFLVDDDDFEFEFLNMKDKEKDDM